jgi:hypothetical protein
MRRIPFLVLALSCVASVAAGDLVEREPEPPPPNAAECGGERIAGVWRARNQRNGWSWITTLTIERVPGDAHALRGTITGTWWTGGGRPPPPCRSGQSAYHVTQPAVGRIDGSRVDFRATSFVVDRILCGGAQGYNADHFTGTLDAHAPILRTVNNDGDSAVNNPYSFRRVRCR